MTNQNPTHRKLVTISVPVFNEEENIERLLARLDVLARSEAGYDFEFLFTDNASTDRSFELLAAAAQNDQRIRVLRFSRNFGFQNSVYTNLLDARGEAAIQVDADLQDPPELISAFLRYWEQGYKVVYGIRTKRDEAAAVQAFRRAGYWLINRISDVGVPRDAGDFRLVDRVIIENLRQVKDRSPYIRGIIASLGFSQMGIPYVRNRREAGSSKFNLWRLIRLGLDGVCSQSSFPLQLITFSGLTLGIAAVAVSFFYALNYLFEIQDLPPGFTTLVMLMLFSLAINVTFIGIIGEYVGRIYVNTRGMPMTVISDRIEPMSAADVAVIDSVDRSIEGLESK